MERKSGRSVPSTKAVRPPDSLREIPLDRNWPSIPALELAYTELEQDEMFPRLPTQKIPHCLEGALAIGQEAAEGLTYDGDLGHWIDRVIHTGVRVRFAQQEPSSSGWVRAQYRPKPPTIEIYRSSLDQLDQFIRKGGFRVREDDLIALHLFHEWFHHLENTRLGRTDSRLPRVVRKRWGPFAFRERLVRLREIAAHAFTQKVMGLSWSPLWLDHLLLLSEKGWSRERIRDHFKHTVHRYRELLRSLEPTQKEDDDET
ncbi:hypothetical protein [Salinithrix halophila]|uniref:Uncharacterized protein n=1 Tax=Salinithrix halophila TaxID=1485204 RepID=A0ABV8JCW4_9BACL